MKFKRKRIVTSLLVVISDTHNRGWAMHAVVVQPVMGHQRWTNSQRLTWHVQTHCHGSLHLLMVQTTDQVLQAQRVIERVHDPTIRRCLPRPNPKSRHESPLRRPPTPPPFELHPINGDAGPAHCSVAPPFTIPGTSFFSRSFDAFFCSMGDFFVLLPPFPLFWKHQNGKRELRERERERIRWVKIIANKFNLYTLISSHGLESFRGVFFFFSLSLLCWSWDAFLLERSFAEKASEL